jgi:ABC-type transport system involved in cytochrome c biogenesis permease subunit
MSAPTSTHVTASPPAPALTDKPLAAPRRSTQRPPHAVQRFAALCVAAVALTVGVFVVGYKLFSASLSTVEHPPEQRIAIPFENGNWDAYRHWVVQEDGRNKPFDSFAREAVRTITGRERFEKTPPFSSEARFPGHDPVAVVVSWMLLYDPDRSTRDAAARQTGCDWEHYPFLLCDYLPLRELIYRDVRPEPTETELHGKYVAPADLRNSAKFHDLTREVALKQREDPKAHLEEIEHKADAVKRRLDLYDRIREGSQRIVGQFGVVALDRYTGVWFPIPELRRHMADPKLWAQTMKARRSENFAEYEGKQDQPFPAKEAQEVLAAYTALQQAYRGGDEGHFLHASVDFFETVDRVSNNFNAYPNTTTTDTELWYNRAVPFQKAWIYFLTAGLALVGSVALGRWLWVSRVFYGVGMLLYVAALGWAVTGFACRVWISGRPPVSNMYESVIFVAAMCSVFGLVLELVYRQGIIALAAALVSTLGFVLADQMPLVLPPQISPLVAVLRSNYWLIIHVMTIVSSYAAFALAWGLGNLNLGLILFAPGRQSTIKTLSLFCYRAIQIGVVLLFLGTMLGGFWAAESWGRFWGWDPKEVWALIAFLCYIIPLHMRYIGWVKDFGLAVCSVVCFAAVVMAWYGVNFVLAAGLHSYGFGGGDNLWVTWAAMINVDLVLCGALSYLYKRDLAAVPA